MQPVPSRSRCRRTAARRCTSTSASRRPTRFALDLAPEVALLGQLRVVVLELLRVERELEQRVDFFARRPDVAEIDVAAALALADRFGHQVTRDVAGDRVGDDQRRRREEVRADVRVDPRFEVTVARQHGCRDDVVLRDRFVQLRRQVARVADTGRAAVAATSKPSFDR